MKKLFAAVVGMIIVAVGCGHKDMNINVTSGSTLSYANSDKYKMVSGTESASGVIDDLEIDWISGNITLEYADVDRLTYFEDGDTADDAKKMYVYEEKGMLRIEFAKAGRLADSNLKKNLTVQIPKDSSFSEISIDTVSGDVKVCGVTSAKLEVDTISADFNMAEDGRVGKLDIETVSGKSSYSGNLTREASIDSVSGDTILNLTGITGYEVEFDSVSGDFKSNVEYRLKGEDKYLYGDQSVEIECSTVSGNVSVEVR